MAVDFDKFDQMVNKEEINKQMEAAQEFDDVPKGKYIIGIEKMEVKPTKANDKLMFAVQAKIKSTVDAPKKQDGRWIFFNRVICGNKPNDKGTWNDGVAIKGVCTWVGKMLDEGDELVFESYSQFADEILDIFQDVCPSIELQVDYDPDAFDPIKIDEVFDL